MRETGVLKIPPKVIVILKQPLPLTLSTTHLQIMQLHIQLPSLLHQGAVLALAQLELALHFVVASRLHPTMVQTPLAVVDALHLLLGLLGLLLLRRVVAVM